jgi:hypothetical protein
MTLHAPDLMSSIFSNERQPGHPLLGMLRSGPLPMKTHADALPFEPLSEPVARRRTSIWAMHHSVHCSIIGTCLSAGELRRLLIKLGVSGAASADDHALHKQAVSLASRQQDGGKFIQKALDRRHESAIKQCARIKDEHGLLAYWEEALHRGDIPGAYWAVLSHPLATDAIMRRAFGDVHMLSHMVGAANRADIRRLRQLEGENAALSAKLELQQRQLRDGFTARDARIRLLNEALGRALAQAPPASAYEGDDVAAARDALIDLDRRLNREIGRRERLEARLATMPQALAEAERGRQHAEHESRDLRHELALAEAQLDAWLAQGREAAPDGLALPELGGMLVLYVGGRTHLVPQLRTAVERAGGVFLHHDGGIEHSTSLLPGLISRAGCAALPIDCVSHDAMGMVKRLCRQTGKPFVPLRTSGLGSLLSGLATLLCSADADVRRLRVRG